MSYYPRPLATLVLVLGCLVAAVQGQTTVFNQNFDGGYTSSYGTSHYQGGSPTGASATVLSSGGNPNGCLQVTVTTTTGSDYFAGQAQLTTVSGNTDLLAADYVFSFDAKGSQAASMQLVLESWQGAYFGGTKLFAVATDQQLAAANTWQTFRFNLGSVVSGSPTGATWQLSFQINAWQWGGAGKTDALTVDNIVLTRLGNNVVVTSSVNPVAYGAPVTFTASVVTNGVVAGNATGQVVFSYAGGPFSTNTVSGGSATSGALSNLPVGAELITAAYFGGNYPAGTNALSQVVNPPSTTGTAQTNLSIYTDTLVNGFQNWSWAAVNLANLNPVPHSGAYCISVTDRGNSQALSLTRDQFNTSPYTSLRFWINGGTGGQQVNVWGLLDENQTTSYSLPALTPGWQQVTVSLAALGVANQPNCTGFGIQGSTGMVQATFYVDDMELVAASPPAVVHLGVDAGGSVLETVDARQFGMNTATWDGNLGDLQTVPLLRTLGCLALRWPGGSTSDSYHWASDPGDNATFQTTATNLGAQVFTTVNYGSGTAAEAAGWVRSANQTNHCGSKYWEIGNECYGSWENDTHAIPQDPYTYATNAVGYIQQMKAAYPAVPIKVGIVVVPGEGSFANNATHFAINPRTGTTNYGWTPIVLSQMKSLGVLPDFLIYHFYPQWTAPGWSYYAGSADSDPLLLQVAGNPSPLNWTGWASAAADLRQQLADYVGSSSTNIELCVTENNSDSGSMGRQSTSIVNALYLAESTAQLMKTEFRSYIWWDLHNGADPSGNFDPTIYGWRTAGDYGILSGANAPYPAFYAEKLLQYFARPGDSVLNGTSDSLLLSAYATRRSDGALTLLVINKHMTTNLTGQIALANFTPWTTATLRAYGIPQDQAAQTNGSPALQDIATNSLAVSSSFSYLFPPLSLTLFTFAPEAARLAVVHAQPTSVQLQLQGQPGTPYVIQSSATLAPAAWIPVSTNRLAGSTMTVSLPISPGTPMQYYRAIWEP